MESFLLAIVFIAAVGLIICILLQATKSEEGLSGVIGGQRQTSYKSTKSPEDIMDKITAFFAISFFVISFFITIFFR
jgi:protein translocase SecG subunit